MLQTFDLSILIQACRPFLYTRAWILLFLSSNVGCFSRNLCFLFLSGIVGVRERLVNLVVEVWLGGMMVWCLFGLHFDF